MTHETPSLGNQPSMDRLAWRIVDYDPKIGALVLKSEGKVLGSGGRDPDDPPGSHLSSRIPLSIRDDGSVQYFGQTE